MTQQNVKVVVTRKLPELVEARMRELFDVTLNAADTPMTSRSAYSGHAICCRPRAYRD